jgi:hypothetical protein
VTMTATAAIPMSMIVRRTLRRRGGIGGVPGPVVPVAPLRTAVSVVAMSVLSQIVQGRLFRHADGLCQ